VHGICGGAEHIPELLQVFPALPRETSQSLDRAFKDCRAYDVSFGQIQFLIDPNDATAAQVIAESTYTCQPRTGQKAVPATQRDIFVLRKKSDSWIFDSTGSIDQSRTRPGH
jgi:hypothetical protein